jgi:hypothetical protein
MHAGRLVSGLRCLGLRDSELFPDSYRIHTFFSPSGAILSRMGKKSDDNDSEPTTEFETPATAETPADPSPPPAEDETAAPSSRNRGVIAAIAGGTAVVGLLLGLFIGWFAFDDDGGKGGRGDKDRMSQMQQQRPEMGGQKRGDQSGQRGSGGRMMPGDDGGQGGQMMPGGRGGRMGEGQFQPGDVLPEPSSPSTQGGVTPQSLQQS